jgi:Zn-finger nucleic acid-binding protein
MKCPKCKNSDLRENKVKGHNTRVDLCPDCKGIWFDRNELESILKLSVKAKKIPSRARKQPFDCPKCRKPLYAFSYPHTMVIVDMCPQCAGIWLDANEFKEINAVYSTAQKIAKKSTNVTCPRCGHSQPDPNECTKCGIIFSKYKQTPSPEKMARVRSAESQKSSPPDSIKGKLLGFIDKSMEVLWA